MKFARVTFVVLFSLGGALPAIAAPALFWISDSPDDPKGPAAPTIAIAEGGERTLYIWAQPETGKILQNFSLDLVIPQHVLDAGGVVPVVDFLDGTFEVYNPCVLDCQTPNSKSRFQYVHDSLDSVPPLELAVSNANADDILIDGMPDGLGGADASGYGLQGFSIEATESVGIGHPNDPFIRNAANGPAWLVASVGFKAVRSSGTNPYFLQVGRTGMLHQGDTTTIGTEIVFGDTALPSYAYDAGKLDDEGNLEHRQFTDPDDRFDVQITVTDTVNVPGDYNGDGVVGPEDHGIWRATFGNSVTPGAGADGNGNGVVDAADYVFWRNRLPSPAASSSSANAALAGSQAIFVPEPGAGALAAIVSLMVVMFPGTGRTQSCRKRSHEPRTRALQG